MSVCLESVSVRCLHCLHNDLVIKSLKRAIKVELAAAKRRVMEKPKVFINKRDARVYQVRKPTPVEIVCGDCSVRADASGNAELLPYRTFLAMDGRCYTCGGGSFVIASELCGALRRTITERRRYPIPPFALATEPSDNTTRELWAVAGEGEALGAGAPVRRVESDPSPQQLGARVN